MACSGQLMQSMTLVQDLLHIVSNASSSTVTTGRIKQLTLQVNTRYLSVRVFFTPSVYQSSFLLFCLFALSAMNTTKLTSWYVPFNDLQAKETVPSLIAQLAHEYIETQIVEPEFSSVQVTHDCQNRNYRLFQCLA